MLNYSAKDNDLQQDIIDLIVNNKSLKLRAQNDRHLFAGRQKQLINFKKQKTITLICM